MPDSKQVLIVDDSRVSRMMIKAIIQQARPDWSITEASNGDEALAQAGPFDLVILDYNMPGMDGLQAGTRLKEKCPAAHMWLLTANIQEATQQKAAAAGISFEKKPITEDKIRNIVDQLGA